MALNTLKSVNNLLQVTTNYVKCPYCNSQLIGKRVGIVTFNFSENVNIQIENLERRYCKLCDINFVTSSQFKMLKQFVFNKKLFPNIINDFKTLKKTRTFQAVKHIWQRGVIHKRKKCLKCRHFIHKRCGLSIHISDLNKGCNLFVKVVEIEVYNGGRVSPR